MRNWTEIGENVSMLGVLAFPRTHDNADTENDNAVWFLNNQIFYSHGWLQSPGHK